MAPIQSITAIPQEMPISESKTAMSAEEVKKQATAFNLQAFGQTQITKSFLILWTLQRHFLLSIPS